MKYMSLDQRGHVQAEYIWIDATGGCRSKTKVSIAHLVYFILHDSLDRWAEGATYRVSLIEP